ncbi:MAG: lactonase family protein [Verrucomicrobiales bacterium]|jgi:6-phosphogluconolactonase (cycloisomerase 2 family)|nr:lactonase family protein [Verrucomicrobiales bacterium]
MKKTLVVLWSLTMGWHAQAKVYTLFVGSYAPADRPGIYVYNFDADSGGLTKVSEVAGVENPSYLAISPDRQRVYAVGENKRERATVSAFAFGQGELRLLNSQTADGDEPCYLSVAPDGKRVVTANYGGGSVSVLPVAEDGSLSAPPRVFTFSGTGTVAERQERPHMHSAVFSPEQKYLFACDLGTDRIYKFDVAEDGLTVSAPLKTKAGGGVRHLVFHPGGKFAYTTHELTGEVGVWRYADGELAPLQTVAADDGAGEKSGADAHLTPDGKFLYASNRAKTNNLAIFRVAGDGTLTKIGAQPTGRCPRNFVISPDGKFLLVANQGDDAIQVFAIAADGELHDTGKRVTVSQPVCLKFD